MIAILNIFVYGCIKEAVVPTSLKIIVQDDAGNISPGATVKISYLTSYNKTKTTDSKGVVEFSELTDPYYMVEMKNGCLSKVASTGNLIPSKTNVHTFKLTGKGTINFNNNSTTSATFKFEISRPDNTTSSFVAEARSSYYGIYTIGTYSIRVIALTGMVYDKTFTGTLKCGGELNINFPN